MYGKSKKGCPKKGSSEKEELEKKRRENRTCLRKGSGNRMEDFLTDTLRIPADISNGMLRVTITGNRTAWVENYRCILEYTDQRILLQGKKGKICIEGERLGIDYYTCDDMMIKGRIKGLRLEGE